ncbi:MAG TPA: hypothetical protein DHW82_04470 [Spirochaetia bacterium]|nr:MAG: hypothetical protein A2Y41_10740 [Spirochaetes bacterium GWB1_36_13]HCL56248.1 hypothetical protein [Spirochaetia bacterium]
MKLNDDLGFHLLTKITSLFFNSFDAIQDLKDIPEKLGEEFYNIFLPDMAILNEKNNNDQSVKEIFKKKKPGFSEKNLTDVLYIHLPILKTEEGKEYNFYFFFQKGSCNQELIEFLNNEDFRKWIYNISQYLYSLLSFFKTMEELRFFFQSIINTLPEILIVINKDNMIHTWKDNTSITGFPSREGKNVCHILEGIDIEKIKEELRNLKLQGNGIIPVKREIEGFLKDANNIQKEIEADFSFFMDDHGQEYFIIIAKDISENKALQRELQKKNLELDQKNKKLEEYLDNYTKELKLASILQKRMISNQEKFYGEIKITTFYNPYEYVGGDYIGSLPVGDKLYFTLADVVGHGVFSAFYSSMYHSSFYNLAFYPENLEDFMKRIYQEFTSIMEDENFFTMILGTVYPKEKKIEFINFGHPLPVFYSNQNKEAQIGGEIHNKIISPLIPFETPKVNTLFYEKGDKLFIYSDGLIEQDKTKDDKMDNLNYQINTLVKSETGVSLAEKLIQAQFGEAEEQIFDDDMSLLILEF